MFKGYYFTILKKNIGSVQLSIVQKKIQENGGVVIQQVTATTDIDDKTTHLITSETEFLVLDSKYKYHKFNVYNVNWISQSIIKKSLIVNDHKVPIVYTNDDDTSHNSHNTSVNKKRKYEQLNETSSIKKTCDLSPIKKQTTTTTTTTSSTNTNKSWLYYEDSEEEREEDDKDKEEEEEKEENNISNATSNNTSFNSLNNTTITLDTDSENEDISFDFNQSLIDVKDSIKSGIIMPPILKSTTPSSPIKPLITNSPAKYVCQRSNEKVNHNEHITTLLQKLQTQSHSDGDRWREFAYKKAISVLKNLDYRIESYKQVKNLYGIGSKIGEKIEEILKTGSLRKVSNITQDSQAIAYDELSKIHGAGIETVKKWYALGINSVAQLEQYATQHTDFLTTNQKIGIKYYKDFQHRIPRDEVIFIRDIVIKASLEIDKGIIGEVCGSFRRGRPDCGDIDILFTHSRGEILQGFLSRLVKKLEVAGLLKDHLTNAKTDSDKYMGVCQLNSDTLFRRIDFVVIPTIEWPFALMYFTGSDHFNRSMRLWAHKNGFSLSERHLVRCLRWGRTKDKEIKGDPIPANSEEEIFSLLGLTYKSPIERDQ
ncbi:hypothetical protein CYY_001334 [Polysphondylium violaceum]|uniref:DNA polymerase n=1 Tax=Polysphondylium violaceum TaxID=133409 RepID=A0A8J4Q081_9MYCE|nr:hypothetical protein CYY_001334 [Polysphondylium violaceum]